MSLVIPPAAAEVIFNVGPLPITNSMVNGWLAVGFFIGIAILIKNKNNLIPKGFQNVIEFLVEFLLNEVEKIAGSRKKAVQFFPLVSTIFFFILFSNWLGLLPGTGSIGVWGHMHGKIELIPLLRPAASDVNLTLAIALFSILTTHFVGLRSIGVASHISKFFNFRGIVRALKKGPIAIMVAVIELGVGLIEIVGEIAKVVSLSLRLFGNIFAGEVLLTVMLGISSYFLPIPFMFLEILVGIVQATVFAMLTLAYLVVATTSHDHDDEHEEHKESNTIKNTQKAIA